MKIDDAKWKAIIEATKAGIERQNASALKHGLRDRFTVYENQGNDYYLLLTAHEMRGEDGRLYSRENKCVARQIGTGELRKAKAYANGRVKVSSPDPKAWAKLADKPADQIVKALKLTGYLMIIGARLTSVREDSMPGLIE